MKKSLFLFISVFLISAGVYSQKNTANTVPLSNTCSCYLFTADTTLPLAQMSLGHDTGGAPLYRCNNCSSLPIKLPFNFCFYGKSYDTVFISNKGALTFVYPDFYFSTKGFPSGNDTFMLAPFWADIDAKINNPHSVITYTVTPTHMIAHWSTMGYNTFDCDLYDNFQITITNGSDPILPAGNNVSYCYWLMQWASGDSTGGSAGFRGAPAMVGTNKGDHVHYAQFGAFDFPGYAYDGPYDTNSGVYWLDNKSLTFNTCVSGNSIPPVIINPNLCDTVTLCATDTTSFSLSFLCPQQGQTATVTSTSPGLSGLTTSTSNANSIYSITTQLIAQLKDTGTHVITVKAIDNSTPALSDSMQFTVFIKACGDTVSDAGINTLSINNSQFTVYPNPNTGIFSVQSSVVSHQSTIEIYNMLGEKVYSRLFTIYNSQFSIDLSTQPSGVYFYRILDDTGTQLGVGKFIIQ